MELDNTYRPHVPALHNGLCTCRGWQFPHPFHAGSVTSGGSLTTTPLATADCYTGRHRPERLTPDQQRAEFDGVLAHFDLPPYGEARG
jgi:hypothetical protein